MTITGWATRLFALIGLGLVLGGAHSWKHKIILASKATPPAAPTPADGVAAQAATPDAPSATVGSDLTLAQAKAMWDEGVTFLDARPERDYTAGHIAGALHITPGNFGKPESVEKLQFLDMEKPVIVYCTGGDCHDSHNLVALLTDYGFKRCHVLTDGYPAWEKAGYDIEKSEAAK